VERLTVAQAAARLGVSQDAVRKRIRRDTIEHDQDADGRIYVYVDSAETAEDASLDASIEQRLVQAQHDEIEFLRRELGMRTEEIRRRDSIIAALTQRFPEIGGPSGPRPSLEGTTEDEAGVQRPAGSQEGVGGGGARKPRWRTLITVAVSFLVAVVAWLTSLLVALNLLYP